MKKVLISAFVCLFGLSLAQNFGLVNVKYFESIAIDSVMVLDSLGAHRTDLPGSGKVWIYTKGTGTVFARYSNGTTHNLDSTGTSNAFVNVYGDSSDRDSTFTGTKTLQRDMFFDDLVVTAGDTIITNGFRIYVLDTATVNGFILYDGGNGGNATNASGATAGAAGAAGAAITGNYFPSPGAGVAGAAGATTGNGTAGNNAVNVTGAIGSQGVVDSAGGAGGAGDAGAGGSGGSSGTASLFTALPATSGGVRHWFNASIGRAFTTTGVTAFQVNGNNASGGSGGAGGNGSAGTRGAGGGSGGSGSNGGIISLSARFLAGSGTIASRGGTGGNGGNGGNATGAYGSGGGGAGGAGGNGGMIVFTFNDTTSWTGTFSVAGGTAGTKGTGGTGGNASGSDGKNGATGLSGIILRFKI